MLQVYSTCSHHTAPWGLHSSQNVTAVKLLCCRCHGFDTEISTCWQLDDTHTQAIRGSKPSIHLTPKTGRWGSDTHSEKIQGSTNARSALRLPLDTPCIWPLWVSYSFHAYSILTVGKSEWKISLGKPRCGCEKIILEWILGKVWTGYIWLRIVTSGGLLWTQ